MLKRPELPNGLREGFLKAVWGRGSQDHDQLLCNSLIGWWWVNRVTFQEFKSLVFRLQPVWGLHAGCQHFLSGGVLVSVETTQEYAPDCYLYPSGRDQVSCDCFMLPYCLNYYYFSYLTAFPLALHSPISLIINFFSLFFETQGRPRRPKSFLQTRSRGQRGSLSPGRPYRVLLSFNAFMLPLYLTAVWTLVGNRSSKSVSPQNSVDSFIALCHPELLRVSRLGWFLLMSWSLYIL